MVRHITFLVYLLDLPVELRISLGLYLVLQICPFNQPYIKFLFVRPRFCSTLPSAPHLTVDALRFSNTSSISMRIVDFHHLVICHARHTKIWAFCPYFRREVTHFINWSLFFVTFIFIYLSILKNCPQLSLYGLQPDSFWEVLKNDMLLFFMHVMFIYFYTTHLYN